MHNFILNTDSYKTSHVWQYPPDTQFLSSYIESRGGRYSATVFFGLQVFLKRYLKKPISLADVNEADDICRLHGIPFYREGWLHILDKHGGFLPLDIEAVPEGTITPISNVLAQVINTDPACAWLTSYIETALLRAIWYPTTIATQSVACRQLIGKYLDDTADDRLSLPFKLHDFGARGASSEESAAIGGLAHLIAFQGTDNLSAIVAGRRYYHCDMAGFSIPAAEHSTITSWGRDNERDAYENIIRQFLTPNNTVAVVSDSYDLWHAIDTLWGHDLREHIIASKGTLVIRPDSGDPLTIVPETIERLMKAFGSYTNNKGYAVLPPYIRVIQGDGVSPISIDAILAAMKEKKLSAENIAFGMGGALLQQVTRDTQNFAMKASAIYRNNSWQGIRKDPVTDTGKRSKLGRLALCHDQAEWKTVPRDSLPLEENQLVSVYRNGELLKDYSLDQIRKNSRSYGGIIE